MLYPFGNHNIRPKLAYLDQKGPWLLSFFVLTCIYSNIIFFGRMAYFNNTVTLLIDLVRLFKILLVNFLVKKYYHVNQTCVLIHDFISFFTTDVFPLSLDVD
jgi:hypothetical protein